MTNSVGYQFIMFRMLQKLKLSTLQKPRSQGGLGVLTLPCNRKYSSPDLYNLLRFGIQSYNGCVQHHLLTLLLPRYRSTSLTKHSSPFNTIFQAVDSIPRNLHSLHINKHTCLQLPLSAIWIHTNPTNTEDIFLHKPGIKKLFAHQLFRIDDSNHHIIRKSHSTLIQHPNLIKHFFRLLDQKIIILHLLLFANAFLQEPHSIQLLQYLLNKIILTSFLLRNTF